MSEFKRILNIRTLFALLTVLIVNMGAFVLSYSSEKDVTLTGGSLDEYIASYPAFLERTLENGDTLSKLPIYQSGFAKDSLDKTISLYKGLYGITPAAGDNRGIVLLLQYGVSDMFLLAGLLVLAAKLPQERKNGLSVLVRSTVRGRTRLYFMRILILALSSLALSFLLYGGNFLCALSVGECDLSRCIQSLPEFMRCPYNISIGEYLLFSIVGKAAVCFAAALIFFVLIGVLKAAPSYVFLGAAVGAEILLYFAVPSVSALNGLKFTNLFSLCVFRDFFADCRFININGTAVPALLCSAIFAAVLAAVFITAGAFVYGKMYPKTAAPLAAVSDRIRRASEKASVQRSLFGWEQYKLLIKRGGMFFMGAAFGFTLFMALSYDYNYVINEYETEWYEKYEGEITPAAFDEAGNDLSALNEEELSIRKEIDDMFASGKYDEHKYSDLSLKLETVQKRKAALEPIIQNMESALVYTRKTGTALSLIKPYTYDLFIMRDGNTKERASFCILIGIIGAISGVFAYENKSGVKAMTRTAYRGRLALNAAKLGSVLLFCVVISVCVHIVQFISIGMAMGYNDMGVPVQSLMFMRDFAPRVSIGGYIALLFAVRAGAACIVGLICAVISRVCRDSTVAMGVCALVFAVPTFVSEILMNGKALNAVRIIGGDFFR